MSFFYIDGNHNIKNLLGLNILFLSFFICMSSYTVSARKYRPQLFQDILGQNHITKTLQYAIQSKKLGHSLLFCGPRGVGKTTCARVLAKTVNCKNITDAIEACGECISCQAFQAQRLLNIYELDAASNNSVEDIRDLAAKIRYAPQEGKYKIYIIDEVHMLSNAAFNAFLKTLEEPPPYVIFILATTEKHKIIPTILSRCQIFDFLRLKKQDMVRQLSSIAEDLSVTYEINAFYLIAEKSDGAMRDALSMFDLILAFSENQRSITYQNTLEHLHILDHDYYFQITKACFTQDISAVLQCYAVIDDQGFDGKIFLNGLADHWRNLLVCKDLKTQPILSCAEDVSVQYVVQASQLTYNFLLQGLAILQQGIIHYSAVQYPRLQVEIVLLSLCRLEKQSFANKEKSLDVPLHQLSKKVTPVKKEAKPFVQPQPTVMIPTITKIKQEATVQKSIEEAKPFTKEHILPYWCQFKEKNKKDPLLVSMFTQNFEVQGTVIMLSIPHDSFISVFYRYKKDLIIFLTEHMHLTQKIDIQIRTQTQPKEKKLYTDAEKFNSLKEAYPLLTVLEKSFALETT